MQHLHLIPVCKSGAVNTNERSTWLSFLCNSFVVLHPIYWYCTYQLTFICSGTLPILKFFASASGFFSTDLSKDWTPLHHTWKKEKKGSEKLCINCQQFRCLSLSWCRFSTRFCQLEEFFCGRSSQYKIVGIYIYTQQLYGLKTMCIFLHIKRCIFFLKKFFFFFFNDFHEIRSLW